jgi:hypothetical protein
MESFHWSKGPGAVDLLELSLEQGPEHHLDCIREPEQFWLTNAIQMWK